MLLIHKCDNNSAYWTALRGKNTAMHTKWWMQLSAILLHPANWEDEWRIGICPEIIAFRVSIKVKTESVTFHLSDSQDTIQRRMLRVNAFQLHSNLKSVLCGWKSLLTAKATTKSNQ